ncbi:hypothetical protein [Anaerotalea alkaliphila]|uniref:DUF2953 domain-containing protein n=1 Tax=Anaerotalea alkaliphila TaxID=2662126 RepID=A0A7X5HVW1_9FIRM|nr:hypothetical protein [Anaerotalea alkaliphila]NDL67626.1 hypothetical protein [Anaerotalea alkaliphila]
MATMLAITLGILKFIGILLLVVLALALLVLLLVLLVPIRYKVEGGYKEDLQLAGRVGWLFHLFHLHLAMDGKGLRYTAKVAMKTMATNEPRPSPKAAGKKQGPRPKAAQKPAKPPEGRPKPAAGPKPTQEPKQGPKQGPRPGLKPEPMQKPAPPQGEQKEETAREKFGRFKDFFQAPENKGLAGSVFRKLKKLFRRLLPKVRGNLHWGADDPATTGMALGAASIFYPLWRDKLVLHPSFEEARLEGDFSVEGKVRLSWFASLGLGLLLDKRVRRLIGELKK